MNSQANLDQIEIQLTESRKMIAVRDALLKMYNNKEFKDVIETAYFKEEAARLVMAKSNRTLDAETQKYMDTQIIGIGALANYFEAVMQRGWQAEQTIEDGEKAREEILAEEIS